MTLNQTLAFLVTSALLTGCAAERGTSSSPQVLDNRQLPAVAATQTTTLSPLGQQVLHAVNAHRQNAPLSIDGRLQKAASVHAADMIARNFRGHHNPDGQGPKDRLLAVDPSFAANVGENIWIGSRIAGSDDATFAQHILKSWINSPTHRNLLEGKRFRHTGIGIAASGDAIYVVQVFAD